MAWRPYDYRGRPNTPKSDPHDISLLAEPLRSRVHQMLVDCPYAGELGVVSAVRDPGTQWDLRLERVGLANIWRFPPRGKPTTAKPARWNYTTHRWEGGSKHQTGEALDFGGTKRAMDWMRANRERYGLALTVTNEGWHVEADAWDVLTRRVHDRPTAKITPYAAGPVWVPPVFHGVLRDGVKGKWVLEMAVTLKALGYNGFAYTGRQGKVFGAGKRRAVKRFQRNNGLKVDGVWGYATHTKAVKRLRDKRAKMGLPY